MLGAIANSLTERWKSSTIAGQGSSLRLLLVPDDLQLSQAFTDLFGTLLDPQVWSDEGDGTREAMAFLAGEMWDSWLQNMRPIGLILPNYLENLPDYLLPCEGQTVARADYPMLWDAIHPSMRLIGDLIQIPDLREKYLRGLDETTGAIGDTFGSDDVIIDVENLPPHDHDMTHHHTSPPHRHFFQPLVTGDLDIEGVGVPQPNAAQIVPLTQNLTAFETVIVDEYAGLTGEGDGLEEPLITIPPSILVPFAIVAR